MEFTMTLTKRMRGAHLRKFFVLLLGAMLAVPAFAQGSFDQIWNDLASGNHHFVNGSSETRNSVVRRKELAKTQTPHVAVLGCSDSRVPPELVFDKGLGDLFVVRSAGESADRLALGSLEYAVEHLGTEVIVVLGHQSCGAVKAACSGEEAGSPNLDALVTPILNSCKQVDKSKPETIDLADAIMCTLSRRSC